MSWPYLQHRSFLAFAHRGGNLATENTNEAFSFAQELGYQYIETDVQVTRDGVVVVFHDASLNRLMGRPDYVADLSWTELSALRFPGGEKIPRLDEALREFPDLRFNIEPKSDRAVEPLTRAVSQADASDRVCIGSFSNGRVRKASELLGPALCSSPGVGGLVAVTIKVIAVPSARPKYGCVQIPMSFGPLKLSEKLVKRFQKAGLQVHVWTLNSESEIRTALALGVDGIISDEVELLKKILKQQQLW